jgi:glycosyltransferase involved in cell wall biosynthesis
MGVARFAVAHEVRGVSGVLMVLGAYWPEVSGGSRQCRQLVRALKDHVPFAVLTTTTDATLPSHDVVDGVPVQRVFVGEGSVRAARAGFALTTAVLTASRRFTVLHLHGVSRKSAPLARVARLLGKRVMLKIGSVGEDDPLSARARTYARLYADVDVLVGPSPEMERRYRDAGLPPERFRLIPNGVDLERFRPAADPERVDARRALDLPDEPVVLFVGYFSQEKRPDLLFRAWVQARERGIASTLLMVGATRGRHPEIDPALAHTIRAEADHRGLSKHVIFIERTEEMEQVYRAADVFVLPSVREGLPNALLEAMASGLPCVATRLPGVTDTMIDDGVSGWLVPPDDADAFTGALVRALGNTGVGRAARARVQAGYGFDATAAAYLALYRELGAVA